MNHLQNAANSMKTVEEKNMVTISILVKLMFGEQAEYLDHFTNKE